MDEELTLKHIWKTIEKKSKFILYFTLAIIFITLIISLLIPKTYESTSEIRLAQLSQAGDSAGVDIFSVLESKNIIESSEILIPAIEKYSPEMSYEDFLKDNLNIEILKETVGRDQKTINYIKITVYDKSPENAKLINEEIIKNFFEYAQPYYNSRLQVLIKDQSETTLSIEQLKKDVETTQNEINSLSNSQLSTEGISKSSLLTNILASYKSRLSIEQDKLIDIENKLANKKEYSIISEPQIATNPTSPNLPLNLIASLIIGLFLSLLIVFIKESLK